MDRLMHIGRACFRCIVYMEKSSLGLLASGTLALAGSQITAAPPIARTSGSDNIDLHLAIELRDEKKGGSRSQKNFSQVLIK